MHLKTNEQIRFVTEVTACLSRAAGPAPPRDRSAEILQCRSH